MYITSRNFKNYKPESFKIRGKPNPCVTDNIRGLKKTSDKWYKEAKKTNDPLAWKFFRQEERQIRIAEKESH